jgi:peroxiredoxin Q/BCP
VVESRLTDLKEGDLAPDFELSLDEGGVCKLSALRGTPVVLFFYPQDATEGCTHENQEFTALLPQFTALGVRLVGISPDTVESHRKFRIKHGLTVPLASDPDLLAVKAFGLWQMKKLYGREFMGLVRTSFLIDREGRIASIVRATRIRGHAEKMLERARAHDAEPSS